MSRQQSDEEEHMREDEEEEEEEEEVLNSIDLDALSMLPMQLMPLASLRPTQSFVGMHQVREKAARIKAEKGGKLMTKPKKLAKWLAKVKRRIPCVLGPPTSSLGSSPSYWLVDHHHLSYALLMAGVKEANVAVIDDLSGFEMDQFWQHMAAKKRLWQPKGDADGGLAIELKEVAASLPQSIAELKDDPYRSLSGMLRRAGGYEKSRVPFSEFIWADYLRKRIEVKSSDDDETMRGVHLPRALEIAQRITKEEAKENHLPGVNPGVNHLPGVNHH